MRFHDSPPVIKSKKLSTKLFRLCSDESIISHRMILNRYSLFCVYTHSVLLTCFICNPLLPSNFSNLFPYHLLFYTFCLKPLCLSYTSFCPLHHYPFHLISLYIFGKFMSNKYFQFFTIFIQYNKLR